MTSEKNEREARIEALPPKVQQWLRNREGKTYRDNGQTKAVIDYLLRTAPPAAPDRAIAELEKLLAKAREQMSGESKIRGAAFNEGFHLATDYLIGDIELAIDTVQNSVSHKSDCAVHNEPAYPNGPCDCGAEPSPEPQRAGGAKPAEVCGGCPGCLTGDCADGYTPNPGYTLKERWRWR